jgi:protein TonB
MQAFGPSSAYDVPPKFVSGAAPIYPITRLRLREPGFALVSFVVDETGRTRDFKVEKTNYSFFGTHAIAAIKEWRFRPATKSGHPVSCRVRFPFHYRVGW